jgi:hypothetical protein
VVIVADKRMCSHRGGHSHYTNCRACKWQLDRTMESWNLFVSNAPKGVPFDASKWELCLSES